MPSEIIKLLVKIILIIFLLKIKLNLGLTPFFNSLLMGLLFSVEILKTLIIWENLTINLVTLELLGIIFLVSLLSIFMEKLKKIEGMVLLYFSNQHD